MKYRPKIYSFYLRFFRHFNIVFYFNKRHFFYTFFSKNKFVHLFCDCHTQHNTKLSLFSLTLKQFSSPFLFFFFFFFFFLSFFFFFSFFFLFFFIFFFFDPKFDPRHFYFFYCFKKSRQIKFCIYEGQVKKDK